MFQRNARKDLVRFFRLWDFFPKLQIFHLLPLHGMCVDSEENLNHCCGLEGHNLLLRPHMTPGEANDGAKFLTFLKIPQNLKNLTKSSPAFF